MATESATTLMATAAQNLALLRLAHLAKFASADIAFYSRPAQVNALMVTGDAQETAIKSATTSTATVVSNGAQQLLAASGMFASADIADK